MGKVLNANLPAPLNQWLVRQFVKAYSINMNEAEKPITAYASIGDLFVRRLKTGVRPIQGDLVHPVDAVISQMGRIQNNTLIQAKGKKYTALDLLKSPDAVEFEEGYFITYYLCPTDYHRIHSPVRGDIIASTLIPGKLWPVNQWSVENIRDLFAINERLVTYIETPEGGKAAVVKVGATNVGKITVAYDKDLISNVGSPLTRKKYEPPIAIQAGEELGTFHMGSTVVLLLNHVLASKIKHTQPGSVKMGERLE